MIFDQATLILSLLQQTCVFLVIAYLFSRTRFFVPLTRVTIRASYRLACIVVFSLFCILGTYLGLKVGESIANTRAIGAVLGGILGGPVVGVVVGLIGGLHRYTMGGMSAQACALSTLCEGLLGGLVHSVLISKGRTDKLLTPWCVGAVTFVAEILQMSIILLLAKPFEQALRLVEDIALPMILANTIGAAMFMQILLERRTLFETQSSLYSAKALKIATRSEGILRKGLTRETAQEIAQIVLEETGVGAVALTDREKVLAFIGHGSDHHIVGQPIATEQTRQAIAENRIIYADGNEVPFQCPLRADCPLGISLAIPLHGENDAVLGTIKLYELKTRLFSSINYALGQGLGRLLSTQILIGQYAAQKEMLAESQIKLLHAQVNPHFLFNTLNTLSAIIRSDPERARQLVQSLSTFFRKNLKRPSQIVSLADELEHVSAYLQIELARFSGKLSLALDVPSELKQAALPAFSLQPLVENAIKHGTSQILGPGKITISARLEGADLVVGVEDNAGLFEAAAFPSTSDGLGMTLVDQRLKKHFGEAYGLSVLCTRDVLTRVSIKLPYERAQA